MDLQAEIQYKENLKTDPRQFLPLWDDSFPVFYRYVARRIEEIELRRKIVELVTMDAAGQMGSCPMDVNFSTWILLIAYGRVSEYLTKSVSGPGPAIASPIFDGASMTDGVYDDEFAMKRQAETFFSSLTREEREIVRLKFFEEVTDGEVMYILGASEGVIGPKIYKVLKRGYEILFGKADDHSGIYFGELHAFLTKLKRIEKIPMLEDLKIDLTLELERKLEGMYLEGIRGGENVNGMDGIPGLSRDSGGFQVGKIQSRDCPGTGSGFEKVSDILKVGSNDPAKIFVQAVKGMTREEIDQITEEYVRKRERKKEVEEFAEETLPVDNYGGDLQRDVEIEKEMSQRAEVPVRFVDSGYRDAEFAEKMYDFFGRISGAIFNFLKGVLAVFVVCMVGLFVYSKVRSENVVSATYDVHYSGEVYQDEFFDLFSGVSEREGYGFKLAVETDVVGKIALGKDVRDVYIEKVAEVLNVRFVDGVTVKYVFDVEEKDGESGAEFGFKVRSFKVESK